MRTTITALTAMMAGASVDDGFSKFGCTPLGGATNGILVKSRPNDDKSKVDRSILARSRELRSKVDQSSFVRSTFDKSIPAISKLMFTTQRGTLSEESVFSYFFSKDSPFVSLPSISWDWELCFRLYVALFFFSQSLFFVLRHQIRANWIFRGERCVRENGGEDMA